MQWLTTSNKNTVSSVRFYGNEIGSDHSDVMIIDRENECCSHWCIDELKKISYALGNSTDARIDTLATNTFWKTMLYFADVSAFESTWDCDWGSVYCPNVCYSSQGGYLLRMYAYLYHLEVCLSCSVLLRPVEVKPTNLDMRFGDSSPSAG